MQVTDFSWELKSAGEPLFSACICGAPVPGRLQKHQLQPSI